MLKEDIINNMRNIEDMVCEIGYCMKKDVEYSLINEDYNIVKLCLYIKSMYEEIENSLIDKKDEVC